MKKRNLVIALLSVFVAVNVFAEPPRVFRVSESFAPRDQLGYTKAQVFYETDFVKYVCINVLSDTAGSCGNPHVKKCYTINPSAVPTIAGIADATKKIPISIEEGSLKGYGGVSEESKSRHNYLYMFSIIDSTNNKRCNVNVSGKYGLMMHFNPDQSSVKDVIYDATMSCVSISLDCIDE